MLTFVCFWHNSPPVGQGLLIHEVSRSHTTTHHSRQDSSGRVINPSQRPLPDNTQHSQQTDIHAPDGIRTHNLSRRAAVNLRLRPRGHLDWSGRTLPPGKTRYPLYRRLGGPRAGLDCCGKFRPTGIPSPERPARRQSASLYNLVNKANLVHNFFQCVYFFSLNVSGDCVPIIRRNNCIYAALGTCHVSQQYLLLFIRFLKEGCQ